ncbi:hypothetical protein [Solibacillus sp. CAU 1738]|uniref:hypothetical protein n=1 Tax=Solibacillus sp. CAU 1738 TaxID=3140363 RepID=UPI003260C794
MENSTPSNKKDTDQGNTNKQKRTKKPYIMLLIAAVMMLIIIGAIILSPKLIKTEELQSQPVVAEPVTFRNFDQLTLNITKYEMFYRGYAMESKEAVEFHSLVETIEKYALFHYLEKHDYKWDEEKRNFYKELVKMELEDGMEDVNIKAYYENMFKQLKITEEEYIENYLLINREYEILHQDIFNKGIGLDETGAYPSGEAEKEYQQLVGITEDYLNELAESIPERLEPMEPQPNLPFLSKNEYLKVTTNEQGEYIFVDPYLILIEEPYRSFLFDLKYIVKEDLTRVSLKHYQDAAQSYESDDPEQMEIAQDLITIFEILERSIDMEYEVTVD